MNRGFLQTKINKVLLIFPDMKWHIYDMLYISNFVPGTTDTLSWLLLGFGKFPTGNTLLEYLLSFSIRVNGRILLL